MVYFGSHIPSVAGSEVEPSLIDVSKPVANQGNCHICSMGYWPNYSLISPEHRASYLHWLSTGKCDPEAQIGYVFLYFYGLERRALTPPLPDLADKSSLSEVQSEIRRLLEIYGARSSSFNSYANSLLDFLDVTSGKTFSMSPERAPVMVERMNLELKASLGLFAVSNQPLPSSWAQAWYLSTGPKRALAAFKNCRGPFSDLFKVEYHSRHGEGLLLPSHGPRIAVTHHPASRTFGVSNFDFKLPMPDVTGLEAPLHSLEEIGDKCTSLLEGYRRFLRANPSKIGLEASISLLPPQIWPANTQSYLKQLKKEVVSSGKPRLIKISQVQGVCSYASTLDKNRIEALTAGFLFFGLGVETDVSLYDKLPSSEDYVAVYSIDGLEDNPTHPDAYLVARLLLHLAAMVASKSKAFDECESEVIRSFIESASGLSALGRARLMARLYLYQSIPPNTFGLKKQIDQLGTDARAGVGDFLVQVALADGSADPSEVRVLEDLFELLGLEKSGLYSKLHSLATQSHSVIESSFPAVPLSTPRLDSPAAHAVSEVLPSVPTPLSKLVPTSVPVGATKYGSGPIRFDPARIAALKADSAKISALLAGVFVEEESVSVEQPVTADEPSEDDEPTLLGLDAELDSLLKFLISKSQWTRAEIETLCSDRGLMVDGTIERINDAAFNQFNCPLIEGDDPIEISCELITQEYA
jgi:tellurite resistance protein